MRATHRPRHGVIATLLGPADEVMLELGAGGELVVARARTALSLLAFLLPLLAAATARDTRTVLVSLLFVGLVNVTALVWMALARHRRRHAWLPWATVSHDVSLTTLMLVLLALRDPTAGLNSMVVWSFYPLAIAAATLRNDGRLVLYAGLLAAGQYLALGVVVLSGQDMRPASLGYGMVSMTGQAGRLLVLLMMTGLACAIVYRMQRLVDLSGRDALTGLPNRAWLQQHAPRQLDAARSGDYSVTLGLIDLDGFRRISTEAGQRSAERAILAVSSRLQALLEEGESLTRISGQEFVLLLRCPAGSAWERLDRVRRALSDEAVIADRDGRPLGLSFSAGLAAFPADGATLSALLGTADRRLQTAKQAGRNRIEARDG